MNVCGVLVNCADNTFLTFGCCLCIGEPLQHSSAQRPAGGQGTGGSQPGRRSLLPGREALPCSPRRPSHGRQSSRNSLRRESSPRDTFFWRCRDVGHPWCCSPASAEPRGRGCFFPQGPGAPPQAADGSLLLQGPPWVAAGRPCPLALRAWSLLGHRFPLLSSSHLHFPFRDQPGRLTQPQAQLGVGFPLVSPAPSPAVPGGQLRAPPCAWPGPGKGAGDSPGHRGGQRGPASLPPTPHRLIWTAVWMHRAAPSCTGAGAPGVEDHLLRSGVGPRAAGEPTALPMASSMDPAMGVEFGPVWPLDAGGGRTWLRCHVLQLGTSRHGVSPCETPRPARTDGCRGKDTVCCRQHAASTAWVKRELKSSGGLNSDIPLCVCGRTCCTQQRPSLPDGIFLLDTTHSAPERRADAPVQPSCLQKPFRHPFLSQPAS